MSDNPNSGLQSNGDLGLSGPHPAFAPDLVRVGSFTLQGSAACTVDFLA
jgi:hypothetical protein